MSHTYSTLSKIKPEDSSTWKNKIFITVDIDWCHDDVLLDTINILESKDVAATWFVTHKSPLLERLRDNHKFELGIHPNFNYLLDGNTSNGRNPQEIVDRLLDIVPEAKSVRSHSMTQSSRILDLFYERGLTHDCNHFIPTEAGICLKPWIHWNGMVKVPYFWEDDVACINNNIKFKLSILQNSLCVFDFHPIHVFLNTHDINLYEEARPYFYNSLELIKKRNTSYPGSRSYLFELLQQN